MASPAGSADVLKPPQKWKATKQSEQRASLSLPTALRLEQGEEPDLLCRSWAAGQVLVEVPDEAPQGS